MSRGCRVRNFGVLLVGVALAQAGCTSTGGNQHAGEPYIVNAQRTSFYEFGPSQNNGPDFALYNGAHVTMERYAFGFSRVKVDENGRLGWVSTDDIAPAPPPPKPSPTPRHRGHGREPTAEEQGPIPLPEFPEAKPPPDAPPFRY